MPARVNWGVSITLFTYFDVGINKGKNYFLTFHKSFNE